MRQVFAGAACRIVGTEPVHMRIIYVQLQSLSLAFAGKFLQYVTPEWSGVYYVVAAGVCAEHGESVVVARRYSDISRSGVLECLNPFAGVEARRAEPCCQM